MPRRLRGDGRQVLEETGLVNVQAEQLGQLVDDDHQTDAGLETRQHRVGDEVGGR